jgi:hypothetical protein
MHWLVESTIWLEVALQKLLMALLVPLSPPAACRHRAGSTERRAVASTESGSGVGTRALLCDGPPRGRCWRSSTTRTWIAAGPIRVSTIDRQTHALDCVGEPNAVQSRPPL